MTADGRPVWVGAISRDIGVIRTRFLGTTHKIDPDVDAERWYLAQNLAQANRVASYGYVGAGGPGFTEPRDTVGQAAYRVARDLKK